LRSLFTNDYRISHHSYPATDGRTLRNKLNYLAKHHVMINEVSLSNGQSLYGVDVKDVEVDYAVFHESGSAGISNVIVPLRHIVYLDTDHFAHYDL